MLIQENIITNLKIENLTDLRKLKYIEGGSNLKINKSALARQLGVDRKTVRKYINGYEKPTTRKRKNSIDDYYDVIKELLESETQVFAYKRVLWQYLKDNHGLKCADSSFREYIRNREELNRYFITQKTIKEPSPMRFETKAGKQAQVDWKESLTFCLNNGDKIIINIFVFLLSFSRFRIYRLSLSKKRDVVHHLLNDSFETIGGVPKEIIFDNMKSVMDVARTPYRKGVVNVEFETFAKDYGFKVKPHIAARPQTKAKVEAPMKILDELLAYNGQLTFEELIQKLSEINDRENNKYHEAYQMHPILGLAKEKDFLGPLPPATVRNLYHIKTKRVRVNVSSMFSYQGNQYSVPPEYIGKQVDIQEHDEHLSVYYNKLLITVHRISKKKLNYLENHYVEIAKRTLPFEENKIVDMAKENLKLIGARYEHDNI